MRLFERVLSRGGLLVALLAVLAACTVVVDEPAPVRPGPGPRICMQDYQPVCARRGDERRTFPNDCQAAASGYRVVHEGQCRRSGDAATRVCTREYQPVCARRGGERRTFGNSCEADAKGYRVIADGPC